jgi:hypothetical protein
VTSSSIRGTTPFPLSILRSRVWFGPCGSEYRLPDEETAADLYFRHNDCKGKGLDVWGNVDDLRNAAIDFNDKTSAFSWRLR